MSMKWSRRSVLWILLMVLLGVWGLWDPSSAQQGTPPQITGVDFPDTIQADGNPVSGFLFFSDPDADVVEVSFTLVEGDRSSLQITPDWTFDPQVKGLTSGVIEFQIAATVPQQATLEVRLEDEAGNRSEPKRFSFEAVRTGTPPSPPPETPPSGTPFADRVVSFHPGEAANRDWGDPEDVLGPPDFRLNPISGIVNLGIGGSITLELMDNEIVDRTGDDLRIWGDPENDELVRVEVSQDGVTFRSLGTVGEMANLDLASSGLRSARFVRITDDSSREQVGVPGYSPGAELDAVAALPAPGTPYADLVVDYQPGTYLDEEFSYPYAAVGPPDLTTDPWGGYVHLGVGGSITLEFWDNVVVDGPGEDLRIWRDPENDERIEVEVSADGRTYRSFGLVGEMTSLDLAQVGLSSVRFVRITDDGSREQVGVPDMSPGAELDAVQALHSEAR